MYSHKMFENEINYSPPASDYKSFLLFVNRLDYFSTDFIKRHYPEQTLSFCHTGIYKSGANLCDNYISSFSFVLQRLGVIYLKSL